MKKPTSYGVVSQGKGGVGDEDEGMEKVITERGLRQGVGEEKSGGEENQGAGMGRVVKWNRKARVNYVHCHTGKGNLQAWRHVLTSDQYRKCGRYAETGKHVAWTVYMAGISEEGGGRGDEKERWMRKAKDPDGNYVVDLVETFFTDLDLR